jgi:DNA-binding CsgD family transcriptional regulator
MILYEQFIGAIEKFIPEGYFQKEEQEGEFNLLENPQFKELLSHAPAVVGIFNNMTMGYEFLSNNTKAILGYDKEIFLCPGGMEKVLGTFKPEHAELHNKYIFPYIYEYFHNSATTKDVKNYRFTTVFQIKQPDGKHIWCMQQIKAVSTDENNYPVLVMVFISDITNIKKDEDVDFVVSLRDQDGIYQNDYISIISAGNIPMDFSKREIEIISHIKKGLSSKEIADALIISEHTVFNHRKNILKKANGLSMIEIIQVMNNKNFLVA